MIYVAICDDETKIGADLECALIDIGGDRLNATGCRYRYRVSRKHDFRKYSDTQQAPSGAEIAAEYPENTFFVNRLLPELKNSNPAKLKRAGGFSTYYCTYDRLLLYKNLKKQTWQHIPEQQLHM